ncbi:hypothetical protein CK203_024940 [Vitis vinifera]|uniref:Uncharacterized protein n=1 Tax=Vitis vinifera TaxID=29760 RepID=A0A438J705_VITVI|nr:hypothetical protein CK203_024940 [Vitis vinifera]
MKTNPSYATWDAEKLHDHGMAGEVFSEVHCGESQQNVMLGKKLSGPMENSTLLGTTVVASRSPNNQMTSQEFGVIIVINHATLMKPAGHYMGCQLIGSPLNGRLISKATLIVPLLKHMLPRHPH